METDMARSSKNQSLLGLTVRANHVIAPFVTLNQYTTFGTVLSIWLTGMELASPVLELLITLGELGTCE